MNQHLYEHHFWTAAARMFLLTDTLWLGSIKKPHQVSQNTLGWNVTQPQHSSGCHQGGAGIDQWPLHHSRHRDQRGATEPGLGVHWRGGAKSNMERISDDGCSSAAGDSNLWSSSTDFTSQTLWGPSFWAWRHGYSESSEIQSLSEMSSRSPQRGVISIFCSRMFLNLRQKRIISF